MEISPISFMLKDCRRAVLRSPRKSDVPAMLEYLRRSAGETDFLLRCPEECHRFTYDWERRLLDQRNASPYECMLVCLVEDRLAGSCCISFHDQIKTRHRGGVSIALLQEYWGQGIGTKMFETMISIAEARGDILQLELELIEGNTRAQKLYEKMGFRIAAIHPGFIRQKDGRILNEYLMIRPIP